MLHYNMKYEIALQMFGAPYCVHLCLLLLYSCFISLSSNFMFAVSYYRCSDLVPT